jgi:hypothetical protein
VSMMICLLIKCSNRGVLVFVLFLNTTFCILLANTICKTSVPQNIQANRSSLVCLPIEERLKAWGDLPPDFSGWIFCSVKVGVQTA